jgi:hypothetical protein
LTFKVCVFAPKRRLKRVWLDVMLVQSSALQGTSGKKLLLVRKCRCLKTDKIFECLTLKIRRCHNHRSSLAIARHPTQSGKGTGHSAFFTLHKMNNLLENQLNICFQQQLTYKQIQTKVKMPIKVIKKYKTKFLLDTFHSKSNEKQYDFIKDMIETSNSDVILLLNSLETSETTQLVQSMLQHLKPSFLLTFRQKVTLNPIEINNLNDSTEVAILLNLTHKTQFDNLGIHTNGLQYLNCHSPTIKYTVWSLNSTNLIKFIHQERDVAMMTHDATMKLIKSSCRQISIQVASHWLKRTIDPNRNYVGLYLLSLAPFNTLSTIDSSLISDLLYITCRSLLVVNRKMAKDLLIQLPTSPINQPKEWIQFASYLLHHKRSLERSRGASLYSLLFHFYPHLIPIVMENVSNLSACPALHGYLLALSESNLFIPSDLSLKIMENAMEFFANPHENTLVSIHWRSLLICATMLRSTSVENVKRVVSLLEMGLVKVRHMGVLWALQECLEHFIPLYLSESTSETTNGETNSNETTNVETKKTMIDRFLTYVDSSDIERLDDRHAGISLCFLSLVKSTPECIPLLLPKLMEKTESDNVCAWSVLMYLYKDRCITMPEYDFGHMWTSMTRCFAARTFWARIWIPRIFGDKVLSGVEFDEKCPGAWQVVLDSLNGELGFYALATLSRIKRDVRPFLLPFLKNTRIALIQDLASTLYASYCTIADVQVLVEWIVQEHDSMTTLSLLKTLEKIDSVDTFDSSNVDGILQRTFSTSFLAGYALKVQRRYSSSPNIPVLNAKSVDIGVDLWGYEVGRRLSVQDAFEKGGVWCIGALHCATLQDVEFVNEHMRGLTGDVMHAALEFLHRVGASCDQDLLKLCVKGETQLPAVKLLNDVDFFVENWDDFEVETKIYLMKSFKPCKSEKSVILGTLGLCSDEDIVRNSSTRYFSNLFGFKYDVDVPTCFSLCSEYQEEVKLVVGGILEQRVCEDDDVGIGSYDLNPFYEALGGEAFAIPMNAEQEAVWKHCPLSKVDAL